VALWLRTSNSTEERQPQRLNRTTEDFRFIAVSIDSFFYTALHPHDAGFRAKEKGEPHGKPFSTFYLLALKTAYLQNGQRPF
jgi:hypothetical protein